MLRIGDRAVAGVLAKAGASVLRYDKCGVGASGADYLRCPGWMSGALTRGAAVGWLAAGPAASRRSPSGPAPRTADCCYQARSAEPAAAEIRRLGKLAKTTRAQGWEADFGP